MPLLMHAVFIKLVYSVCIIFHISDFLFRVLIVNTILRDIKEIFNIFMPIMQTISHFFYYFCLLLCIKIKFCNKFCKFCKLCKFCKFVYILYNTHTRAYILITCSPHRNIYLKRHVKSILTVLLPLFRDADWLSWRCTVYYFISIKIYHNWATHLVV